ncbi:MAG: tetratricopeptide repeat protein [bacterium]|nr:tetratricopeptide repeat protein [bacterium]MDI1335637.1 tetratricopeptide repeat protein [Lacunisphaera sp.]
MKVLLLSLALLTPVLPAQAGVSFLRYLEETAGRGEAESQFILGLAYLDGWDGNIAPDSSAARWCEVAAELDDARPAFMLAQLRKANSRITKDGAKAMACLSRAAEQGDDYARVILGELLLEGHEVPVDWRHGTELIRTSALAGFVPAQFRLGMLYLIGDDSLPKNNVESLAWLIVAAEAGSRPAQEIRDERTRLLGKEVALLAIKRSRQLRVRVGGGD